MVDLVDTNQTFGKFKHVVSKTNDDKLSVFSTLFDVSGYDGDLCIVS